MQLQITFFMMHNIIPKEFLVYSGLVLLKSISYVISSHVNLSYRTIKFLSFPSNTQHKNNVVTMSLQRPFILWSISLIVPQYLVRFNFFCSHPTSKLLKKSSMEECIFDYIALNFECRFNKKIIFQIFCVFTDWKIMPLQDTGNPRQVSWDKHEEILYTD